MHRVTRATSGRVAHSEPSLLVARVLYFVIVAIGLVLFVVPGVIAAVAFVFHSWIVVVDGESPWRALTRSAALVKGRVVRSLGTLLPSTIVAAVWLAGGFLITGLLLRASRPFPVFKIAPLTMTLTESAIVLATSLPAHAATADNR